MDNGAYRENVGRSLIQACSGSITPGTIETWVMGLSKKIKRVNLHWGEVRERGIPGDQGLMSMVC